MAYERTIDLMDESLFPADSFQGRRLKKTVPGIYPVEQTDDEIVAFVVKELSDTLEGRHIHWG
ncbi:MAG: hypothetical protein LBE14_06280 [Treponema sp.]|jgi:hypothetical protein|nr:hypothetical protein [Treponema sp.]